MHRLWIILIHMACLRIQDAASQYDFIGQQYFQMQQMPGMLQMPQLQALPAIQSANYLPSFGSNPPIAYETSGRRSRHHKHKTAMKESSEDEYDDSSDISVECRCSCNKCVKPKPCCIPICEQCNMIGANQGRVMLVPYAYPVFFTHPPDEEETAKTPSLTEKEYKNIISEITTKSNQKEDALRAILNKVERDEIHDTANNGLDDVDMRLMKIIKMVQSATKETDAMMPLIKPPIKTTTTTTTPAPTKTTSTTPITTTTTVTTTTTTPPPCTTTTSTTSTTITTSSPKTKKNQKSKKKSQKTTVTTTTRPTSPTTTSELAEIKTSTTDASTLQTFKNIQMLRRNVIYDDVLYKRPHQNNKHHKYILTSMRRMKDNYLPKYGVVPIPDDVAERLLQKIRSLRTGSETSRSVTPENFFPEEIRHRHNLPFNAIIRRYQDK